mmetsp:Transcript_71993/g.233975  ORF Transcript_71993/g.233975 Transcript_71993/m.233975 type:complete len:237 (-) Transcript_71993:893-1603(-)
MRDQVLLVTTDGVLGAPVEVALRERVRSFTQLHLATTLHIDLHSVSVVHDLNCRLAPRDLQRHARLCLLAQRKVDGALEAAVSTSIARSQDGLGPIGRTVGVPRRETGEVASHDLAAVQRLRRPEVAACGLPAHGRLELVELKLGHRCVVLQDVPIDGLRARGRREGAIVGPILVQLHVRDDAAELHRPGELRGGVPVGQTPAVLRGRLWLRVGRKMVFELPQEGVGCGDDLVQDA